MLEWRADILNNCNQLNALAIIDSYVPAIEDIPRLPSLTNLTVSSTAWTGVWSEMPSGLARVDLSPFLQPQITCLNFNGNSLDDQDIVNIGQLKNLQEIYSKGNNLSTVPDLTALYELEVLEISLDSALNFKPFDVSILLPNPRRLQPFLKATFKSKLSSGFQSLQQLKGDLRNVDIHFEFSLAYLNETVFLEPLQSMSVGSIWLNGGNNYKLT